MAALWYGSNWATSFRPNNDVAKYITISAITGIWIFIVHTGLTSAFDADHIAAIDNTVRKMIQHNQDPMGVGRQNSGYRHRTRL
ncbi:hypothetical protein [Desulfosporosinus acidiphilus]|uniref:HoxN/HupN/NixA family nickel/cobalt transporter n=1 Tax=Desulfosporosinus acidiphilus TaxID=885581 RepID=UPI0019309965|nr:hypothetical protein [Desulfosporosinus acidiphilus]